MPNDMRDRLIELISDIENELLRSYPYTTDEYRIASIADHLIKNGAILLPSNVGYTVNHADAERAYAINVKTVLLNQEDSEKALREREGE